MRMQKAKDFLELASHCESEAAKTQDKFLRYQLLSFAESYRTLAESTVVLDRSTKALEIIDRRRKAQAGFNGEAIQVNFLRQIGHP